MDVVVIAAIVPIGIDFWASRRSPDRLEPAMIPTSRSQFESCEGHLLQSTELNIPQAIFMTEIA